MAVGETYVFEIVMLAAGADAFLRRGSAVVVAGFEAEEDVLELVHSGVGEEQCGIVGGDKRGRVDLFVSALDEIVQEFAANLRASQHLLGFNRDSLILAFSTLVGPAAADVRWPVSGFLVLG